MFCRFRIPSNIAIALIILMNLLYSKLSERDFSDIKKMGMFLTGCCLLFLLQITGLLYDHDLTAGLRIAVTKTSLLFIPLIFFTGNFINPIIRNKLLSYYVWIALIALLYCLAVATYKNIVLNAPDTVFFYHEFVNPFKHHAVHVSVMVFVAFNYLLECIYKEKYVINRYVNWLLIFIFLFFLMLLSSKLVIIFSVACFGFYFLLIYRKMAKARWMLISLGILFMGSLFLAINTRNPISERFKDVVSGESRLFKQTKFTPGNAFNGVQFRLLQWRIVWEILNEKECWLTGAAPANAQALINEKYISYGMYTGNGKEADKGFSGFNTHNQLLESTLESGLPGTLGFILICLGMIKAAIAGKNRQLRFIVVLLLTYSFVEAVLDTQYGLIIFLFLPLFFSVNIQAELRIRNNTIHTSPPR